MKFDAIIFDCDGVLIDSERIAVAILTEDLAALGLRLSVEEVHHRYTGWTTQQIAASAEAAGFAVPEDWVRRHNSEVREAVATSVEPIAGVIGVLDALDAAGIRWGVASQSGLSYLERALGRVGIWQRAEGRVASSQMVANPKPAPDVYLKAMELVGRGQPDRGARRRGRRRPGDRVCRRSRTGGAAVGRRRAYGGRHGRSRGRAGDHAGGRRVNRRFFSSSATATE